MTASKQSWDGTATAATDYGQKKCSKHVEVHFLAKINLGN